eukprot:2571539-Amphidinium_carterae.1
MVIILQVWLLTCPRQIAGTSWTVSMPSHFMMVAGQDSTHHACCVSRYAHNVAAVCCVTRLGACLAML